MAGHARWLPGAVIAAGSVVLAVTVPASWWGVTFVAGVLVALLGARGVVPPSYAAHWTRTTVLVTLIAAVVGLSYAFEVRPWGPRRGLYLPVLVLAALVGIGALISTPGGRRADQIGDRRQNEDAHSLALRRNPR